jgi:hypothetical protein
LTSENGFPKKDFRKWTSEKWTSENGLLKTYFRNIPLESFIESYL